MGNICRSVVDWATGKEMVVMVACIGKGSEGAFYFVNERSRGLGNSTGYFRFIVNFVVVGFLHERDVGRVIATHGGGVE
jgi:hypothetical protein